MFVVELESDNASSCTWCCCWTFRPGDLGDESAPPRGDFDLTGEVGLDLVVDAEPPSIDGLDGIEGEAGLECALPTTMDDEGDLDDTLNKSFAAEGVDTALVVVVDGGNSMLPRDVDVCIPPASDGLP